MPPSWLRHSVRQGQCAHLWITCESVRQVRVGFDAGCAASRLGPAQPAGKGPKGQWAAAKLTEGIAPTTALTATLNFSRFGTRIRPENTS